MMDEKQIAARLLAAHNAYVEKTGNQPASSPTLDFHSDGRIKAHMFASGYDDSWNIYGYTAAEALNNLDAQIAAIPSRAERLRAEAAKAVGAAIEACRAAGYPDDLVNPLAEISKRISENAISFRGEMG